MADMTVRNDPITPSRAEADERWVRLDDLVPRLGRTERFAHWWTTAMLAATLVAGLAVHSEQAGPQRAILAGTLLMTAGGLLAAVLFGNRRALVRSARTLFTVDRWDVDWLNARLRHPRDRTEHREWEMFSTAQKLFAWALAVSFAAVVVTVILPWSGSRGAFRATVVACAVLLGAHVVMSARGRVARLDGDGR